MARTADEFLLRLEAIGWFNGMPETACEYIRNANREAEEKNSPFSPWPETKCYTPLNILVANQLANIVSIYEAASYGMFTPENIITKELPESSEAPACFTARISFTIKDEQYSSKIRSRYADCLDPEFMNLINKAMFEQTEGLCFCEVHEEYGTIALVNLEAVIRARAEGIIPNYDYYWKRNRPGKINRKALLAKISQNWYVSENKGKVLFYRDAIKIRLSSLYTKKESGNWLYSIFNFTDKYSIIKFGTNGTVHNDVSRRGSYLSFRGHYMEIYRYSADGANEEEVRFDTEIIHRSHSTITGNDEHVQIYSPAAVAWADEMLAYLDLPTGGESFQDFCIDFLRLPVGWIQNIYYNPDAEVSFKNDNKNPAKNVVKKNM